MRFTARDRVRHLWLHTKCFALSLYRHNGKAFFYFKGILRTFGDWHY